MGFAWIAVTFGKSRHHCQVKRYDDHDDSCVCPVLNYEWAFDWASLVRHVQNNIICGIAAAPLVLLLLLLLVYTKRPIVDGAGGLVSNFCWIT